jgi:hypothetical protein
VNPTPLTALSMKVRRHFRASERLGGSLGEGSSSEGPSGPSVVQDPRDGSFLESSVMQIAGSSIQDHLDGIS